MRRGFFLSVIVLTGFSLVPACAGEEHVRPLRPAVRDVVPADPPLDKIEITVEISPKQQAPNGLQVFVQLRNRGAGTIDLLDPAATSMIEITTESGRTVLMPQVPMNPKVVTLRPANAGYQFTATMKEFLQFDESEKELPAESGATETSGTSSTAPFGSAPQQRKAIAPGRYSVRIIIGMAMFGSDDKTGSRSSASAPVSVQYVE